jgi:hypothetical protein
MLNTPNLNSVTNILWVQSSEIQLFYKNLLIMKKLNLEMLRLTSADVLERSQMKKITGGYSSASCSNNQCGGSQMIRCCSSSDQCSGPTGFCQKR